MFNHKKLSRELNVISVKKQKTKKNTEVLLHSEVCQGEAGDHKSIGLYNLPACVILSSNTEMLKCRRTEYK